MAGTATAREDIDRVLLFVRRSLAYWKRALIFFVLGTAIAVPYVFTRPRSYRSETVFLYQETIRSADITGGEAGDPSARRVGARLKEVLFSRASLEPIIKDLKLYPTPAGGRRSLVDTVDEMRRYISFRAREGDTFEIAFEGGTPEEAQEVTRRLGECIIQEASNRRTEHAKALKEFLTAESDRNIADLRNKEGELAKFAAVHPALAARLRQPGQALPVATNAPAAPTGPSDPLLASLEARASRIDRQLAKAAGKPEAPPPPPPKPVFQPLPDSPELVSARKNLMETQARYTDKHPDVIAARSRLKAAEDAQTVTNAQALDAFNAAQAAAQKTAPDEPAPKNAADEAALRQQLADLQAQIAQRRTQLGSMAGAAGSAGAPIIDAQGSAVALEVEFRRLEREVNEGRERQHQLEDKLFKASITASSVMSDRNIQVSVLDPAYLPMHPTSKSRSLMLATFLAILGALAVGIVIVSTKLDDRIYDRVDLERLDILPIIGVIPRAPGPRPPQLPSRGSRS